MVRRVLGAASVVRRVLGAASVVIKGTGFCNCQERGCCTGVSDSTSFFLMLYLKINLRHS